MDRSAGTDLMCSFRGSLCLWEVLEKVQVQVKHAEASARRMRRGTQIHMLPLRVQIQTKGQLENPHDVQTPQHVPLNGFSVVFCFPSFFHAVVH